MGQIREAKEDHLQFKNGGSKQQASSAEEQQRARGFWR